jgi:hypothetical protein
MLRVKAGLEIVGKSKVKEDLCKRENNCSRQAKMSH